jgi:hypothetical protein
MIVGWKKSDMKAFRYRTAALVGPWRATEAAAADDAIRAKQAVREGEVAGWRWVIPGDIEERDSAAAPAPADNDDSAPRRRERRN